MNISLDNFKHAWNVFLGREVYPRNLGVSYSSRPDRPRYTRGAEKSIVNSVYNRIALDVAAIDIMHVKTDDNGRYIEPINSSLNRCLTLEANIDQSAREFLHDIAASVLDEGVVAVVPVETSRKPMRRGMFDIYSMRVGKVIEWYPRYVKVRLLDDRKGRREEVLVAKECTAIITNPFYAVMNEPNSTMQRLIRKLALLDMVDEKNSSGKRLRFLPSAAVRLHTVSTRKTLSIFSPNTRT